MEKADKVVRSRAVFTGCEHVPFPGAVAVKGREILAVGSDDEIAPFIGTDTQIIECGDRLVMPGLNDSHLHLLMGSIQSDEDRCLFLLDAINEQDCVRRTERFAQEHPDNEWIFGWGWISQAWEPQAKPTRASLDATGIDRPICLADASMHVTWVNSKALEMLGISDDKDHHGDPYIVTDENGMPTGVISELPSQRAIAAATKMDDAELSTVIGKLIPKLNAQGITAVSDMYPLLVTCEGAYEAYRRAIEEAGGSLRVTFYPSAKDPIGAHENARRFQGDYVRFGGVKFVLDGVVEEGTGFMHEPYVNANRPDDHAFVGSPQATREELETMVANADGAGWPIRIHAIGDAAATMAIDAIEKTVRENGKKGLRHCLEHTDNIRLDDIDRMARLGIAAAIQPCHSIGGGLMPGGYETIVGLERKSHMWRYREEADHGVVLGMGTDWPCAGAVDPFVNLYAAVVRSLPDGTPEEGLYRENALTLGEALQAYTRGAAWVEGFEGRIGTLSEGKLADIAVMDRNPFAEDPRTLKDMRAVLTIFDGRVVYSADDALATPNH